SQGETANKQMRDASEAMRSAANDLRRRDTNQASSSAGRALDALRQLERQLESARPDERRRGLGEMQLAARQPADAQRQSASGVGKSASGDAGKDAVRRLAGEQERLAERTRRLQDALKQQGAASASSSASDAGARGRGGNADAAANANAQAAAAQAAK